MAGFPSRVLFKFRRRVLKGTFSPSVSATLMPCHADDPTWSLSTGRWSKPKHISPSRSPPRLRRTGVTFSNSSGSRSRSRSRRRGSRPRSRSRSRSRDRSRVYRRTRRGVRPSSMERHSPVRKGFENRILRSRSPIRRGRSVTPSEPPQYPYHPNEAVVITNDVTSVSYIMDGRCSIPGDGKLHKVTIAILPFTATIHHVITPRVSSDAYLQVGSLNSDPVFSR